MVEQYSEEEKNGMFDVVNSKYLHLTGENRKYTKRQFKTWKQNKHIGARELFIKLYETCDDDYESELFNKYEKVVEENELLQKKCERYEKEITSLKEDLKSTKAMLSTEIRKHKQQIECKELSNHDELEIIQSLNKRKHKDEIKIQERDTTITDLNNQISVLKNDLDEEKEFTTRCMTRGLNEIEPLQSDKVIFQASVIEESKFTKYFKIIGNKLKKKEHGE
mgnify:FL=1